HGDSRRVRAHGVLRRLGGRHLPAVLHHHRLRDGVDPAGGPHPVADALRYPAEAPYSGRHAVQGHPSIEPGLRSAHAHYQGLLAALLRRRGRSMAAYLALVVMMGVLFVRLPSAFLPDEDQGQLLAMVSLPPGTPIERTKEVMSHITKHLLEEEEGAVQSVTAISGFNFGGRAQNNGIAFIRLKPWEERKGPELRAQAVAARASDAFAAIKEASAFVVTPPAVSELGIASGF